LPPVFSGVSQKLALERNEQDNLQVDWKAPIVAKKMAPYQPTLSRPLNSCVIFGMAVATMV
jgi:hypothetical protein